jgi:8-oxo-dGTP diphosphatase
LKPTPILITVDGILLVNSEEDNASYVCLIQRKNEPFKDQWCLPGGFVDPGETLENAVTREIEEETGLFMFNPQLFKIQDDPDRDPRDRVVSIVFWSSFNTKAFKMVSANDDAKDSKFIPLQQALDLDLGFDHKQILEDFWKSKRRTLLPKKERAHK